MGKLSADGYAIISALIVPMDGKERVDYHALEALVEWEIEKGVGGFYCCGSSGEGLLLSLEERKKLLEKVLEKVDKRLPVIAHVGTLRTEDAIHLACHARDAGADAVSMIPPYYYRFSEEEIISYYKDIARAVPDIDILVYNIPQFTGIEFEKTNLSELYAQPNIAGIKHTSKDLYSLERIKTAFPEKKIYNGFDEQFLAALSMGADGTIGTLVNVYPDAFRKIKTLYLEGKMEQALQHQQRLNEKIEILCQCGIFNAVKYILTKKGIPCGTCRKPFQPLTQEQKTILDQLE